MPIDLGPDSLLGSPAPTPKKPSYLIMLDDGAISKTRVFQRFIALDKPRPADGLIEVRGFYCNDKTEEEIIKSFAIILAELPKELTLELMLPLHRIYSIRSLVFNAQKSVTSLAPGKDR